MKSKRADEDDEEEEEDEYVDPREPKALSKKQAKKVAPKVDRGSHKLAAAPAINQDPFGLDAWRATTRATFFNVPIVQLKDVIISRILNGFGVSGTGPRAVLEWRLSRLWQNKPNICVISTVLGSSFYPPTRTVFVSHIDKQDAFAGFGWQNVLQHKILPYLDLYTTVDLMYTCKLVYGFVGSLLEQRARKELGSYGTPMALMCNVHLKWLVDRELFTATHMRERLGFKTRETKPQLTADVLSNIGYVDHLRYNDKLLFEQMRVKILDSEFAERIKDAALNEFNAHLTSAGYTYVCFKRSKNAYKFIMIATRMIFSHEFTAQLTKYCISYINVKSLWSLDYFIGLLPTYHVIARDFCKVDNSFAKKIQKERWLLATAAIEAVKIIVTFFPHLYWRDMDLLFSCLAQAPAFGQGQVLALSKTIAKTLFLNHDPFIKEDDYKQLFAKTFSPKDTDPQLLCDRIKYLRISRGYVGFVLIE